jgi:hypothetical protein
MPESFAGITVPEEPGAVRHAASTFKGVAGALHGVSGDLRAVPGLVADDGIVRLHSAEYQAANPPDIDELSLPDGFDNDNPSTFERVWAWPFDAEGEGTISNGSDVVASQDDLRWDPVERVYRLPVEGPDGSQTELQYRMFDEEWKLVRKVDGGRSSGSCATATCRRSPCG